ncbi:MAG: hydantoinase/oxoprolinase family protein [Actinobacteria bacterium]|nr:MAG: hydantoinase/oxoprolinase family protein [Actinomycetota bacterium]
MLLGVDVGGTFTDAVLVSGAELHTAKAPTTPADQSQGVMAAIAAVLARAGARPADVELLAHGMTVATNALLEGRGARTAFVATDGFTDIVELGRQARRDLYRLCATWPAPFAPPERRFGARERMGPGGVLRALEGADELADAVAASGAESVAVCLLHAYRDPSHEIAVGEALRARLPDGVHVSLSHEVVGTFREFERAATTEVDAALSPLVGAYLRALAARAADEGLPEPRIMQSSGGLAPFERAADHAALAVLSGPAGGAAAAALVSAAAGERRLLCFDMGGTSCDVSVVEDGAVREAAGREVGGRPLALPMVDIHTVGAGGGSIGWRDPGGAVGPRSAGAEPGPACYGRGGAEPTVTDANLVLGRLDAAKPLSGVELDVGAARGAIEPLADELGLSVEECALGIVRVANAEMVRALRVMTVERGLDPRAFTLLAFGGAGPLHAAEMADELGIRRILIPPASGVLSALGLAAADRRTQVQRTLMLRGEELTDDALADAIEQLRPAGERLEVACDMRYRGQAHELTVRDLRSADELRAAFADLHEERYGYRDDDSGIELVTLRVTGVDPGPRVELRADHAELSLFVPEGWQREQTEHGVVVSRA